MKSSTDTKTASENSLNSSSENHSISPEKKPSENGFFSGIQHLQTYIYAGYAYILMMGIANDSIFYGFLGINIISYSNVLDVILSPLVHLIDAPLMLATIAGLPLVAFGYIKLLRYLVSKSKKKTKLASHQLIVGDLKVQLSVMTAIMVFSGFIGFGVGAGSRISTKLEQKALKVNHEIVFRNGDVKNVHVIGSNSGYVFYVEKDADVVSISPIQENIVVLKKISKK